MLTLHRSLQTAHGAQWPAVYNVLAVSFLLLLSDPVTRLQHEIVLRHHIYAASGSAVAAMESWALAIDQCLQG